MYDYDTSPEGGEEARSRRDEVGRVFSSAHLCQLADRGKHHNRSGRHDESPRRLQEGINQFHERTIFNSHYLDALTVTIRGESSRETVISKHKRLWHHFPLDILVLLPTENHMFNRAAITDPVFQTKRSADILLVEKAVPVVSTWIKSLIKSIKSTPYSITVCFPRIKHFSKKSNKDLNRFTRRS
jgi:hypothetical protein